MRGPIVIAESGGIPTVTKRYSQSLPRKDLPIAGGQAARVPKKPLLLAEEIVMLNEFRSTNEVLNEIVVAGVALFFPLVVFLGFVGL